MIQNLVVKNPSKFVGLCHKLQWKCKNSSLPYKIPSSELSDTFASFLADKVSKICQNLDNSYCNDKIKMTMNNSMSIWCN